MDESTLTKTNESIKTQKPKGMGMPARTVPETEFVLQVAYFTAWLELLLGIKDTKENEKRILFLNQEIRKNAWGLSIEQMMEAFQMYVDGKLPIEPMSGFIDTIHFKKIIKLFKEAKSPKMDMGAIAINLFNKYQEKKHLKDAEGNTLNGCSEAFDHLYNIGILPKKDANEATKKAYYKRKISACGLVLAPMIDKKKWFEKEDLKGVPRYKELMLEMKSVHDQTHPDILPLFKRLVLEAFFEQVIRKNKHLSQLI